MSVTSLPSVTFTGSQVGILRDIVKSWISEGFTTPPYLDEVYDIIEALGIEGWPGMSYDLRRPNAGGEMAE